MSTPDSFNEESLEYAWMGLGDTSKIQTINPFDLLDPNLWRQPDKQLIKLIINPANLYFTCKHIFNVQILPFQNVILRLMWKHAFPMLVGSRGAGKSWLLGLYSLLRAMLFQGSKVCITGAGFRQAKNIFNYCETIWNNAHVLRDFCGNSHKNGASHQQDRWTLRIGDSLITALPLGTGEKIRGERANTIIVDEMASVPIDIYEVVVSGFGAVSMDPVEAVKRLAEKNYLRQIASIDDLTDNDSEGNQQILSGTAYYAFNHFYDYFKKWKAIIQSKGDEQKLREVMGGSDKKVDWRDYCIIRLPHELLPPGFLDEKTISRAQATQHKSNVDIEYGACWVKDSDGFYRRSLIETCVVGRPKAPIVHACGEIDFSAVYRGDPRREYIMGVDPASENDNFSIVILEQHEDHRRIVFCWTYNREQHKLRLQQKLADVKDYYQACASKIRELCHSFNIKRIALDTQGGGFAIQEALEDNRHNLVILPVVEDDKIQDTDHLPGQHILCLINFAQAEWVSIANHGMRDDFERKKLLFPAFDSALLGMAMEDAKTSNARPPVHETLEDIMMEIEELKDELATIVHSQTGVSMRDRWDTPEVKLPGMKKGRLRKDRYSSLLMANAVARELALERNPYMGSTTGGFAHDMRKATNSPKSYSGPEWFTKQISKSRGYVVPRK